jgi:hypothetical protein
MCGRPTDLSAWASWACGRHAGACDGMAA